MTNKHLEIKLATENDLDALAELESANFSYDQLGRRSFRRFINSQNALLWCCYSGAKGSEKLIGYALVLTRKNSQKWRLYSLVVDQQARGQGIAGKLLETVIVSATDNRSGRLLQDQTRPLKGITLEVKKDNQAAIALYEKYGFQPIGERTDYYSDGSTALRMILKFT